MFFSFSNFTNLIVPGRSSITDTSGNFIQIYYMFVDANNQDAYNSGRINILTSMWVDANTVANVFLPGLTSSNFNAPNYTVLNAFKSGSIYSGNTLLLSPLFPGITPYENITLVLRVGLPMNSPATFSSVSAYFSLIAG
jgi:hypothetical protein